MSSFEVGNRVSLRGGDKIWTLTGLVPFGDSYAGMWNVRDEDGRAGVAPESQFCDPISPTHYTPDSTGKDYLARCEDTYTREEMIGAFRFTIGKYVDRMGKKSGEPIEKELAKIIDYATRAKAWLEGAE